LTEQAVLIAGGSFIVIRFFLDSRYRESECVVRGIQMPGDAFAESARLYVFNQVNSFFSNPRSKRGALIQ
jgi:hypothetical protein